MSENISVPSGYFVTIYFKNSMSLSGVVLSWTTDYIIIKAQQGNNKIVIYNPKENVLMVKVNYDSVPSEQPASQASMAHNEDEDEDEGEEDTDTEDEEEEVHKVKATMKKPLFKKIKEIEQQKKFLSNRLKTQPENIPELNRYKNVVSEFIQKAK